VSFGARTCVAAAQSLLGFCLGCPRSSGHPDGPWCFIGRLKGGWLGYGHSCSPGTRPTRLAIACSGSPPKIQSHSGSAALLSAEQEHLSYQNFQMGTLTAVVMSGTQGAPLVHLSPQPESSLPLRNNAIHRPYSTKSGHVK